MPSSTVTDTAVEIPPVEGQIVMDMVRRGIPLCVALVVVSAAVWGTKGAVSAAVAVALVVANFAASAALLGWSAKVSPAALMGAALGGFLLRLGAIALVLTVLRDEPWVAWPPLAFSLLASHLGLLLWELRHVSASLAYPGVRPRS